MTPKEAARKGVPFTLADQSFLLVTSGNANLLACVREALVNAMEAGATEIHIFGVGGHLAMFDNGHGMTARSLQRELGGLGAGSKEKGRERNLGVGMKAVATVQNPSGTVITSWTVGQSTASKVILGQLGPGQYGLMFHRGTSEVVKAVPIPAFPSGAERFASGTLVELKDTPYQPYVVRKYLNNRFLTIPKGVEVKVWHDLAGGPEGRRVVGLLACMREMCPQHGSIPLPTCTLHWGIRAVEPDAEAATREQVLELNSFTPSSVAYAWRNESFRSWEYHAGGRQLLGSWGIRSGGRKVLFVIEARDGSKSKIAPTLDRSSISGWDEETSKVEVMENLPEEVLAHMDEWEREHFTPAYEQGLVDELMRLLRSTKVVPTPPLSPRSTNETGGTERAGEARERDSSRPRVRRALGVPGFAFVDDAELEGAPVGYDSVKHRIYINTDHAILSFLRGKKAKGTSEARALLAANVIHAFTVYVETRGELPDEEPLLAALGAAIATSRLSVENPGMFRMPKAATK